LGLGVHDLLDDSEQVEGAAREVWSRSTPHREWWRDFLRSSGGTGFWHEAYFMRGGMEAVYDDVPRHLGFAQFAPLQPARGPMFSARNRAKLAGESPAAVVQEADFYAADSARNSCEFCTLPVTVMVLRRHCRLAVAPELLIMGDLVGVQHGSGFQMRRQMH
jgi:hypothetical protein